MLFFTSRGRETKCGAMLLGSTTSDVVSSGKDRGGEVVIDLPSASARGVVLARVESVQHSMQTILQDCTLSGRKLKVAGRVGRCLLEPRNFNLQGYATQGLACRGRPPQLERLPFLLEAQATGLRPCIRICLVELSHSFETTELSQP